MAAEKEETTKATEAEPAEDEGGEDDGTIDLHQISNSSIWYGTGDSSQVYDQWIINSDGTWSYRFRVFQQESEYHVWEENIPGYSSPNMDNTDESWQSISVTYQPREGQETEFVQNPDPVKITNKKTTDDDNLPYGSLSITKAVTGSALRPATR